MASLIKQTLSPDVDISVIEDLVANVSDSPDTFTRLAESNKLAVDSRHDGKVVEVTVSETASIPSSLFEHVEENGRTYHKYKEGKYTLPNDELEQNRLDLQHELCKMSLHGKLYLAPLKPENLKYALDFGTGTGIWAIELAEAHPDCKVIGSDLSPIQPEFIPSNCSFEIDDMDDDWIYSQPFSYIHGRLLVFCFTDAMSIFRKAFDALEPGGWFEMQDTCAPLGSIDGTLEGTPLLETYNLIAKTFLEKRGVDVTVASRFKSMMEEVGFVDVKEVKIEWPIGTWAKSSYHKRIGAWYQRDLKMATEGIMMGLFTRMLGWKKEEVDELLVKVLADMDDKNIHSYQPFYVVYGRKPEAAL
ncbi:S-adenosyl-L-methionine-dependent methyltransferase [Leptodontidium sp. 2 PMI_412]|nr:S-adenosyl-L-methionine-dependent methyltransferase [Leptodontidium sp. 2 PMI_412]